MEQIFNRLTILLISMAADYPVIGAVLVGVGAVVAVATVAKPIVYVIVNWTTTTKDNAVADKFYGIIEGTAIDFKPFVDLFRKKKPKFAGKLDLFAIKDKDDV